MEIGSVSSSISSALLAATAASQLRAGQATEDQSTQQAQGTTATDERQTQQAVTEAEKNRPTVNINGQTVGTLVNTTA